jgi:tetratricopeptide (TPR) repeat protein
LKATDVESNALLVSRDLFDSAESTLCSDEAGRALKSEHTLANEAASTLAVNLVSGLIPKRNERPSDLIDEIEVLSEADANSLEKATDEAAKGKMKTAKTGIESLLKRYPNNGALLFNAGYIEQALGNFSKAKGYYQSAQQSPFVPEDLNKYMVENDAWLQRGFTSVSKD